MPSPLRNSDHIRFLAHFVETHRELSGLTDAIEAGDPALVAKICFSKGIRSADENFVAAASLYLKKFHGDDVANRGIIGNKMKLKKQADLVTKAKNGCLVAWDTCLMLLVMKTYNQYAEPLHSDVYKLASRAMAGTSGRPAGNGRPENSVRDDHIYEAVLFTAAAGSKPTRNAASPPRSASDFVSKELSKHKISMGYDAVVSVWKKRSRESPL